MNDEDLAEAVKELSLLTDFYVIDFYTRNVWEKLPEQFKIAETLDVNAWHKALSGERIEELGFLFDIFDNVKHSICRRDPISLQELSELLKSDVIETQSEFPKITMDKELRIRIKQKKQHEIDRLAKLIELLRSKGLFHTIVDVGAGLGHLSRILAHQFPDIRLRTIEGNAELVDTAYRMDEKFSKRVGNFRSPLARDVKFISPNEALCECDDETDGSQLLIGLHPCGDLSATIIRTFIANPSVSGLIVAGCCYHKLNGGLDKECRQEYENLKGSSCTQGFPLSEEYAKRNVKLSYSARELACHAIEQYAEKLVSNPKEISVHWYRSFLEWLLVKIIPHSTAPHSVVKSVKRAYELSFVEYARKALVGKEDLLNEVEEALKYPTVEAVLNNRERDSRRIHSLYCLRLLVAPLIESLIVRDRILFFEENGYKCEVFPLFDPRLSPRNLIIYAWK